MLVALAAALGVAAYVLQVRYGVWRWLAALAATPAVLVALLWPDTFERPGQVWWFVAACLVLAVAGASGVGRASRSGLQVVVGAALLTTAPFLVVDLTLDVPWLALFAVLVAWPPAAALGLTALLSGRRSPAASRPQSDEVDDAALEAFAAEHGRPALGPVVVVIAAYDEERGIGAVLESLPTERARAAHRRAGRRRLQQRPHRRRGRELGPGAASCGARATGARVPRCAWATGSPASTAPQYIVTTDADGQYDPGDIPAVLEPVVAGRADFVTGSRLLGRQETRDRVRRLGVHVFAWVVSAMAGQRVTDTSFGLRAMRAEVTERVTLNQPQYQSSELMLGVISHGFRLLEVPGTMHVRSQGSSKKGRNLVYGSRYARVVVGTWWREGCPRPVTERAPAFRDRRDGDARPAG